MLQYRVTNLEDVDEGHRAFYVADPDGDDFRLDIEGEYDVGPLTRAIDHEKKKRQAVEERIATLKEEEAKWASRDAERATAETAERERINRETDARIASAVVEQDAKHQANIKSLQEDYRCIRTTNEARRICSEIAVHGHEVVLLPHVSSRIAVERHDGEWAVVVKDEDGKPSALTLEQLKDEIRRDPALRPVIRGASAPETEAHARDVAIAKGARPANTVKGSTVTRADFDAMSPKRQQTFISGGGSVKDARPGAKQ